MFGFDMLPFCFDKLPSPEDYVEQNRMTNYIRNPGFVIRQGPVYTWRYRLGTLMVQVEDKDVPSFFHRKMQQVFLGIKWSRIN